MNKIFLEKLEFNKILSKLSTYSITALGKNYCINLLPQTESKKVIKYLSETTEALSLIYKKGNPFFNELNYIPEIILILKNQNFLSIKQLLDINSVLKTSHSLKKYYFDEPLNTTDVLTNYFDNLYINPKIEQTIDSSIIDENTIDDHASEKLYIIRNKIRQTQKEIKNKLQSLLSSKYLQEPIITLRQDRFVVPVKSEYRSDIKGFIHDTSASGSTIFIEPLSVFELNNTLSDLRIEENIEIEKILQKLSSLFFDITNELENTYNLIGLLDFIFAKAKYSKEINGNPPQINNNKIIYLNNAKHPLLDKKTAVPITLEIGKKYSTLLITGPNTGGKTVTLKTIGLLSAMAMSGLHIPASEKSSIFVFDNIFADIGDEQSILESLSTFSSHMKNIVTILNEATSNSLVLVDELGSGTDPIEGASLALSIIEYLTNQEITTVVTTHYQELKEYALVTEKIENASCEFDLETLSPTYKLLIGVPGKSNAFAISKKLGLPNNILEKAKTLISSDKIKIEDLLKNIYDDKSLIEKEKEIILKQSQEIQSLKQTLENQKNEFENNKKDYIQKAKQEAKEILLDTKEEANNIIKQMQLEQNNPQNLNKLRNKINNKLSSLSMPQENSKITDKLDEKEIIPGITVFIPTFNKNGIVLSYPNQSKKVNLQIDNIKTTLSINQLSKPLKEKNTTKNIPIKKSNFTPKKVETELNVIGMNIEESLPLVDKFLDDSSLAHLEFVRIVHGKGSGALGKGIQNYLKKHPHCKNYRYGTFGEGEMGVTIVELK